jgi:hypothetical protein
MIQRVQSLYLALVVITSGVVSWFFPLFYLEGNSLMLASNLFVAIFFFVTMFLAFLSLLNFKNRKSQFVMNRLNMLVNLGLTVYIVYKVFSADNYTTGTTGILPMLHVILLSVANRNIQKDEKLVRSADRIR